MIAWRDSNARVDRRLAPLAVLRWACAAVAVAAAHGGAVAWIALDRNEAAAAPGEPPPAIVIDLAPLAVSPETPVQEVAPGPQMIEAQPDRTPDDSVKTAEELDNQAQPKPKEVDAPPDVRPLPDPPHVEIRELSEKPNIDAVLIPPPPKAAKMPQPKVKRAERRKPINPGQPKAERTTAPPTSPNPRPVRAAAPSSSASSAPSMSPATWKSELMAWLNRYKRFPPNASGTGTASVAFTISRSGQVLSARLVSSSGDPALDSEAVSLPRRASPVPPPPPDIGGSAITLAVPIRFDR